MKTISSLQFCIAMVSYYVGRFSDKHFLLTDKDMFVEWAKEFENTHKKTKWGPFPGELEYEETLEAFVEEKLKES